MPRKTLFRIGDFVSWARGCSFMYRKFRAKSEACKCRHWKEECLMRVTNIVSVVDAVRKMRLIASSLVIFGASKRWIICRDTLYVPVYNMDCIGNMFRRSYGRLRQLLETQGSEPEKTYSDELHGRNINTIFDLYLKKLGSERKPLLRPLFSCTKCEKWILLTILECKLMILIELR